MALQVIGAGFGRTGTLSLKVALEKLGFSKCYHMMEVMANDAHVDRWREVARGEPVDWEQLFAGYQATVDWPSCNFWEAQLAQFPDAKVLLSERDPERWYESIMSTIYPSSLAGRKSEDPTIRDRVEMAFEVIWDVLFDNRMDDKAHVIGVYLAHNERVKRLVPSDKLLVFNPSDGWEPLCAFLECSVPEDPFPRVNTTHDFHARMKAAMRASQ
ncbi:MAG: sulfotransferase family protein [Gammaproteobacteria bacterium]|nr:sulfotransferase family protein [Gammaproteobacteria bacterium]